MADPTIISNEIIEALDPNSTEVFQTTSIMQVIGALGRKHGCQVACHKSHYADAEDPEWLYDMVWWQADENNYIRRSVMVLESELRNHSDDLDMKLVQSRTDVRVWISTSPNNARQHIGNCKKQIRVFDQTMPGDRYVLAIYDYTARKRYIETYIAS